MTYLVQYECKEPGCHHMASLTTSQREPLPILQCPKHMHLPVMEVTFNHKIKEGNDEGNPV